MKVLSEYIEDDLSAKVLLDDDRSNYRYSVQMYKLNVLVNTRYFNSAGVAEDFADDWVRGLVK